MRACVLEFPGGVVLRLRRRALGVEVFTIITYPFAKVFESWWLNLAHSISTPGSSVFHLYMFICSNVSAGRDVLVETEVCSSAASTL